MMTHLSFHIDWVTLIMICVCSMSYTMGVNEGSSDNFQPSRRLRQGNPLSLYLFLISVEGFSTLLKDTKRAGLVRGATIGRERLSINHLFFLQMIIFFDDATERGTSHVQCIIKEYEVASR